MKAIYTALAAFQQEVPPIKKNASGYGYKFADLDEITKVIKPLLAKHNLGYTQPIDGTTVKTIVFHTESGESIEGSADIPQGVSLKGQNEFQTMGSAITYLRRYGLVSTLGLVTDEDADAAGEQVKTTKKPVANGANAEVLARAKAKLNKMMESAGYDTAPAKKNFIKGVLKKETIDYLNDCDAVADALENEKFRAPDVFNGERE